MFRLPFQAGLDGFCGVTAALDGDLRDAGKRLAVFIEGKGEIADDENIGIVGNGEIGQHFDAAAAIGLGVGAFGDFAAEVVGSNTTGPEDGARGEFGVDAVVSVVDAVGIDIIDHGVFEDFHTEAGDEFFGFGGKILGVGGEDTRSAIEEENAGLAKDLMWRKSLRRVSRAISASAPASSRPVAPAPTMTKVSQARASASEADRSARSKA